MTELKPNSVYRIELCSGEIRRWRYLGLDDRSQVWWRDMETGLEFNESGLMYAWQILGEDDAAPAD
jgi:hypothetical protein